MLTTNPITAFSNGVMSLKDMETEAAWEKVIDCVSYPIVITPLFFKDGDEEFLPAVGDTNTGRDTEFFGVAVDRNRTGEKQIIATVTGTYGTLHPKGVYSDLKRDLQTANIASKPVEVYVSGNGGRSILQVAVDGKEVKMGDDTVSMRLALDTSVDGSKKHVVRLVVSDQNGVQLVGLGEKSFSVGTKHTKTISERHAAFSSVLVRLVAEWEQSIVPMLGLFNDYVFDSKKALDIFETILENSDVPERHIKKAMGEYIPSDENSMYSVLKGISVYLNGALAEKPERLDQLQAQINKRARSYIEQTINTLRKGA